MIRKFLLVVFVLALPISIFTQNLFKVGDGWAGNSINTVVFRKNSVVSDKNYQFTAYYNADGYLTLAKRRLNSDKWQVETSSYKAKVTDAHNAISIMLDGNGFLHVSWDHHGNKLNYARSLLPYGIKLGLKQNMTGKNESSVTYPEFYRLPNGNLIFLYRDGRSGNGNLVINSYDIVSCRWLQVQSNLINGEGKHNAYWQAFVDKKGTIHISWVWRSSPDVSSNNSMCYARSTDAGVSWYTSSNQKYSLPITAQNAEYAARIPQKSELINQTSMTVDRKGNPYIATYFKDSLSKVPQYHIIYFDGAKWITKNLAFRKSDFSLSGIGTKMIPIARPQILLNASKVYLLFRDEERNSRVSIASCNSINDNKWKISDLTSFTVGAWEPSYDTELWKSKRKLHIFVQKTIQVDAEGVKSNQAEPIYILEY